MRIDIESALQNERPASHLTYCLNVHPGETWAENFAAIRTFALPVRDRVAGSGAFGLGLRLGARAASELALPGELRAFRDFLAAENLYVFTVNAFPYGRFHGARVKQDVYKPDWREPDRLAYTNQVADILAELLPDGVAGSISTVPGSYGEWIRTPADLAAMAANLGAAALHAHQLLDRTGRDLAIALEPEPDCLLESTGETIRFFEDVLLPQAGRWLIESGSVPASGADRLLRRHLGMCLDTCHLALRNEELVASCRALAQHGIAVPKIQLSAALDAPAVPAAAAALAQFCDPVYLHQVSAIDSEGRPVRRGDLDQALLDWQAQGCPPEHWRVHCHVPIYFQGDRTLGSTAGAITPGLLKAARDAGTRHFEIETYTFNVLPAALRSEGVVASVVREYRHLFELGVKPG